MAQEHTAVFRDLRAFKKRGWRTQVRVCGYHLGSNGVDGSYGILRLDKRILLWRLSSGPSWQEQLLRSASKNLDLVASVHLQIFSNFLTLAISLTHTHTLKADLVLYQIQTHPRSLWHHKRSRESKKKEEEWFIALSRHHLEYTPSNTHWLKCTTLQEALRVNRLPASD